jgi:hypothetical protein
MKKKPKKMDASGRAGYKKNQALTPVQKKIREDLDMLRPIGGKAKKFAGGGLAIRGLGKAFIKGKK